MILMEQAAITLCIVPRHQCHYPLFRSVTMIVNQKQPVSTRYYLSNLLIRYHRYALRLKKKIEEEETKSTCHYLMFILPPPLNVYLILYLF